MIMNFASTAKKLAGPRSDWSCTTGGFGLFLQTELSVGCGGYKYCTTRFKLRFLHSGTTIGVEICSNFISERKQLLDDSAELRYHTQYNCASTGKRAKFTSNPSQTN